MNPCDIWKELDQKFGLGDAGSVIMLRRQWERLTTLNWRNLGTLFSHLKQLRNDINRKMRGLAGKDMVTEAWLYMELLSPLQSEFWGGSISMTEEWFSVRDMGKSFAGKKRTQAESSETRSRHCFYCFDDGHWKKDCPTMAADRDPKRPGGKLFRSNIKTAPGAKKRRDMTVKKGSKSPTEKDTGNDDEEMTPVEKLATDNQLEADLKEADEFEFKERVPPSEGSQNEAPAVSGFLRVLSW
ncbi:hypothetical protein PHMEG_00021240 [Phytophthora megakarya]|uniref:CCHC-type domain-containing protein n=1 Tax=Phytophthora megakarya TaxID=4795 RepID=A0A225VN98_9STRA|nr:hypothetical protein PHMEG_00021240 [Phytophthora megakarya]